MLRKLISIIAIILLCNSIAAKHSDDYLIGNYSYWCSWNKNGLPYLSTRDTAFGHMKTLGYNSTVCNTYNGDQDLDDMLEALDSDSLDAILTDFSWDALQTETINTSGMADKSLKLELPALKTGMLIIKISDDKNTLTSTKVVIR